MTSALIRPRSETVRPAAFVQARTPVRSARAPPVRPEPPRLLPGTRRPASVNGASAFSSLALFVLPRSISYVTPPTPNETVSAFAEPSRSSVITTDTRLDMTPDRPRRQEQLSMHHAANRAA